MAVELERPGNLTDVSRALEWVWEQLARLETAHNQPRDILTFKELHAEPTRLYTGLTVLADGTDWNPGSGAGVYTYYGSAWHKLG